MLGVIGLGYVGFTSLLGFTQYSSKTIGYDISSKLIEELKRGTFISKIMRCKTIIKIIIETLT